VFLRPAARVLFSAIGSCSLVANRAAAESQAGSKRSGLVVLHQRGLLPLHLSLAIDLNESLSAAFVKAVLRDACGHVQ
jgi:hypothetical protein